MRALHLVVNLGSNGPTNQERLQLQTISSPTGHRPWPPLRCGSISCRTAPGRPKMGICLVVSPAHTIQTGGVCLLSMAISAAVGLARRHGIERGAADLAHDHLTLVAVQRRRCLLTTHTHPCACSPRWRHALGRCTPASSTPRLASLLASCAKVGRSSCGRAEKQLMTSSQIGVGQLSGCLSRPPLQHRAPRAWRGGPISEGETM